MEKIHFTTKASNYIKEKVFTPISTKKTELEISREVEEINELYVDAQTSISLQEHSIAEAQTSISLQEHSIAEAQTSISLQEHSIAEAQTSISLQEHNTTEADTLNSLHHCILIPSYAFRDTNGNWLAQVHGWAYGTSQSRKKKLVLGMARRVAGLNKDDEKNKLLEDRISMFLTKNLRNQRYKVQIVSLAHPSHMELDKNPDEIDDDVCDDGDYDYDNDNDGANNDLSQDTRTNYYASTCTTSNTGHFRGTISIPVEIVDEWVIKAQEKGSGDGNHVRLLKLEALPESEGRRQARPSYGFVSLIEAEGISVISDIDDTIKLTGVASGTRVALSNTFLYDLREVPGMAEVYMDWYNKGASIHYVSNSPWQLFPMLKQFFHIKRFPPGSAHLKLYNDLVKSLLEEPGLTKSKYIKKIFEDFPRRKFILIGDSGEYDMEIYSKIASMYPKRVLHVFIRDVSTKNLKKLSESSAKRSRTFPFIPTRSSSNVLIRTKTMPPAVETSKCNNNSNIISNTDEMPSSPETLTPVTPDTPLQKFFDRVEECKKLVPKDAFTLFERSEELRENKIVNSEFELLLEKQRQRPSRQNTHIDLN